jgi:hypothetical protein
VQDEINGASGISDVREAGILGGGAMAIYLEFSEFLKVHLFLKGIRKRLKCHKCNALPVRPTQNGIFEEHGQFRWWNVHKPLRFGFEILSEN